MRVLITAGTGMIGRALARELSEKGHHVTVTSRDPGHARSFTHKVQLIPCCPVRRSDSRCRGFRCYRSPRRGVHWERSLDDGEESPNPAEQNHLRTGADRSGGSR